MLSRIILIALLLVPSVSWGSVLATDNFTRANNADLGTDWDPVTDSTSSGFRITSNSARAADTSTDSSEVNNTTSWPANQYSKVTYGTAGATAIGTGIGPGCRMVTGSKTGYRLVATTVGYELARRVGVAFTSLSSGAGVVVANGSTLQLNCITSGSNMLWQIVKNGTIVVSGVDTSPVTSGSVGIAHSSDTVASPGTFTAWEGGSISSVHQSPIILGFWFNLLSWIGVNNANAESID